MKSKELDKKIGMPDIDVEWAKFEQEVIAKDANRARSVFQRKGMTSKIVAVVISMLCISGLVVAASLHKEAHREKVVEIAKNVATKQLVTAVEWGTTSMDTVSICAQEHALVKAIVFGLRK